MARQSRSALGRILALLITAAFALVVVKVAPSVGQQFGTQYADHLRKSMGIASPEQVAAQRRHDARTTFARLVGQQHPALVRHVPVNRVSAFAVRTCIALDNYYQAPHYAAHISRDATKVFGHPTRAEVRALVHLAAKTTCPGSTAALYQFSESR